MITEPRGSGSRPNRLDIGIALAVGFFTASAAAAQTYELVHAFRNSGQPRSSLIQASDGYFYGTTYWGGASGVGTVFRIDAEGHATTLHSFGYTDGANPAAGIIQANDGNFYGTTALGGRNNRGAIFRMDASGTITTLHSFDGDDGANPLASLVQAPDGDLYGTTFYGGDDGFGTVFEIDLSGNLTSLHSFHDTDGALPSAALVEVGPVGQERFFGTTYAGGTDGGGTVFSVGVPGGFGVLHNFQGLIDGALPKEALLRASDGNFYGTTENGGEHFEGTAFRMDPFGEVTLLHSFFEIVDGSFPKAALVEAADGSFYGTTGNGGAFGLGTIFKMDSSGKVATVHDFAGPDGAGSVAPLMQLSNGDFLGTTSGGGANGYGTVFRMDSSGIVTTVWSPPGVDGASPGRKASLLQANDGNLYGTTLDGGENGRGIVFRIDSSGELTTVHDFTGADGCFPSAALVQATDGAFYGSTQSCGEHNLGTIFKFALPGIVTTMHSFDGTDGSLPENALVQAADGDLYGTIANGGTGSGTAFRLELNGIFTGLHNFDRATEGSIPAALVQADDGDFYGTAADGGANANGTVFKLDGAGVLTPLHDFAEMDGSHPAAALIQATDGDFYGSTAAGGANGKGTVFRMDSSGNLETLHSFDGTDGSSSAAALLQATDGNFYGATADTLFRIDSDGNLTTLHTFHVTDGYGTGAGLIQTADGFLWGTTSLGGPFFDPIPGLLVAPGVVFRLTTASVAVNEVTPTSGPASSGTALDVLGGGFSESATVTIGGVEGTDVTVLDPTFLYLFTPPLSSGTLNDVSVTVPDPGLGTATATRVKAFFADFADVPQLDPFHDLVETIFRKGITAGCGGGNYCSQDAVTRAQMAVFLLKAEHGAAYVPPACTGVFGDVSCPSMFADWIEQLAAEGITAGCGSGNYCPTNPVTRAQMAAFLLKAEHGSAYAPSPCTGVFADVSCPSLFADWIEQLAAEGITGGCGGGNYCPDNPNTRAQMAVFLVKTFHM
jgi:uncharacterized repeat protein (TIGR03803 family)